MFVYASLPYKGEREGLWIIAVLSYEQNTTKFILR